MNYAYADPPGADDDLRAIARQLDGIADRLERIMNDAGFEGPDLLKRIAFGVRRPVRIERLDAAMWDVRKAAAAVFSAGATNGGGQ